MAKLKQKKNKSAFFVDKIFWLLYNYCVSMGCQNPIFNSPMGKNQAKKIKLDRFS